MTALRAKLVLVAIGLLLTNWEAARCQTSAGDAPMPGLVATYSDRNHRVRLIVPAPNSYLDAGESVHPSIGSAFDAEWKGLLSIVEAGDYTIACDPGEVYVDNAKVTNKPLRLATGRHPIAVKYHRQPGRAVLRLEWKAAQFPLEPIPSALFSHAASEGIAREGALAEQGRYLVEEFGCVNCHTTDSPSLQGRAGPDLAGIGSRVSPTWLNKWLEAPSAFRGGAVMPALADEQQRRDVASYLSSLKAASANPTAKKPREHDGAQGNQLFGLIGCTACHQQGLSLDGLGSKTTAIALADYLKDPAKLDPGGRMPSMLLTDQEALQLAAFLTESRNPEFEQPFTAGDLARGKALVQSQGCLSCHALRDSALLQNQHRAPRLDKLAPDRGCLAAQPTKEVPRYRLTGSQREAIQAFLRGYRQHPDVSRAPVYELSKSFEQFRCVACHQVDQTAPTATLAEAAPTLTDAGAKLRTGWIDGVITKRARVRGWLELRMPDYDSRQVKLMAAAFAKASGVEPGDGASSPAATDAQRARGAGMIGNNPAKGGMACIGCHDWGIHKSTGEQAPQLINTALRLRYDWYHRWMLSPGRILSGTSMPNYFSSIDRKRADETIDSLWAALSMGDRMTLPDGLGTAKTDAEAKPAPDREAIVIRWDMPEATPAAIAVGLPGQVSYCFDAGESRLRYAWLGGFVDMTGTLYRKTDANLLTPTATLVGEVFYRSPEFPLRIGSVERIPQRRFRGYRIVQGSPEFHYQLDGIDVHERVVPAKNKKGITREFTIARVDQPMWFLAGQTDGVFLSSTRGAFQNGRLQIPRGSDVHFSVTISKEKED